MENLKTARKDVNDAEYIANIMNSPMNIVTKIILVDAELGS